MEGLDYFQFVLKQDGESLLLYVCSFSEHLSVKVPFFPRANPNQSVLIFECCEN